MTHHGPYQRLLSLLGVVDESSERRLDGRQIRNVMTIHSGFAYTRDEYESVCNGTELMRGVVHCGAMVGDSKVRSIDGTALQLIKNDCLLCGWMKTSFVTVTAMLPQDVNPDAEGAWHLQVYKRIPIAIAAQLMRMRLKC